MTVWRLQVNLPAPLCSRQELDITSCDSNSKNGKRWDEYKRPNGREEHRVIPSTDLGKHGLPLDVPPLRHRRGVESLQAFLQPLAQWEGELINLTIGQCRQLLADSSALTGFWECTIL